MTVTNHILTRKILDVNRCSVSGCTLDHGVLYLHARCHPGSGVVVHYEKETGLAHIECGVCKVLVASLKVAES